MQAAGFFEAALVFHEIITGTFVHSHEKLMLSYETSAFSTKKK
jgi:hypothetical protein